MSTSTVPFTCPACGYRARFPSEYAGKDIHCPGCNAAQTVVVAANPPPPTDTQVIKKPNRAPAPAKAAARPAPKPAPSPAEDDEEGDDGDTPADGHPPAPGGKAGGGKLQGMIQGLMQHPKFRTIAIAAAVGLILEIVILVAWRSAAVDARETHEQLEAAEGKLQTEHKARTAAEHERDALNDEVKKAKDGLADQIRLRKEVEAARDEQENRRKQIETARDETNKLLKQAQDNFSKESALRVEAATARDQNYDLRRKAEEGLAEETAMRKKLQDEMKILKTALEKKPPPLNTAPKE